MLDILKVAILRFGLDASNLIIEQELQPNNWHGDLHYKISVNGELFSARLLSKKRYEHNAFVEITDDVLEEQIKFCKHLNASGIPFMKHCSTLMEEPFTIVQKGDEEWRFVLFKWIEGEHITHCTEAVVEKFGATARRIHEISSKFQSKIFERKSQLVGYQQFFNLIKNEIEKSCLTPFTDSLIQQYMTLALHHLEKANTSTLEFIVQSDLNPLNILWSGQEEIVGVVDFESITYTDRVEGLAWLIKWYSRTDGIESIKMSSTLAKSFLRGYGEQILTKEEIKRLPSLLWLSGCLNWNFTAKIIDLMRGNNDKDILNFLGLYLKRGEALISLLDAYPESILT